MLHISWLAAELIHVKFELSEILEITMSFFIATPAFRVNSQNLAFSVGITVILSFM